MLFSVRSWHRWVGWRRVLLGQGRCALAALWLVVRAHFVRPMRCLQRRHRSCNCLAANVRSSRSKNEQRTAVGQQPVQVFAHTHTLRHTHTGTHTSTFEGAQFLLCQQAYAWFIINVFLMRVWAQQSQLAFPMAVWVYVCMSACVCVCATCCSLWTFAKCITLPAADLNFQPLRCHWLVRPRTSCSGRGCQLANEAPLTHRCKDRRRKKECE